MAPMKTLLVLLSLTLSLSASAQTLPPIHVECVQDSLTQPIHVKCVQVWRNAEAVPSRMPAAKPSDDYNITTREHGERFTLSAPASAADVAPPKPDAVLTVSADDADALLATLNEQNAGPFGAYVIDGLGHRAPLFLGGVPRPSVTALRMKRATAERLLVALSLALGEKPKRETTP